MRLGQIGQPGRLVQKERVERDDAFDTQRSGIFHEIAGDVEAEKACAAGDDDGLAAECLDLRPERLVNMREVAGNDGVGHRFSKTLVK
jgi:hypothetical protein